MKPTVRKKMTPRTKLALWLLVAPTGLLIVTFVLFALINFLTTLLTPIVPDGELFGPQPIGLVIANVIFFIFGAISVISWLPGLITGIVLLATKK